MFRIRNFRRLFSVFSKERKGFFFSRFFLTSLFSAFFLLFSPSAFATNAPDIPCPEGFPGCYENVQVNYKQHSFFRETLPNILDWLMGLGAAGAVMMGVIAGSMYLFGGANEELRTRAHKTIAFALIGLLLSAFSFFIVEIINRLPYPNS